MQKPKAEQLELISILNCAAIAREIGVSQPYVYLLLTGKRTNAKRITQIQAMLNGRLNTFLKPSRKVA